MTDDIEKESKKDLVEQALEKAKPLFANISFGGVMGFCSGMALKKVGQKLAVIVGCGFVALQAAVTAGYIEGVNWAKIQEDVSKQLDKNQDGKIDQEDAKLWWKVLKEVLVYKLPSAGGFSLGFLYGVRYG